MTYYTKKRNQRDFLQVFFSFSPDVKAYWATKKKEIQLPDWQKKKEKTNRRRKKVLRFYDSLTYPSLHYNINHFLPGWFQYENWKFHPIVYPWRAFFTRSMIKTYSRGVINTLWPRSTTSSSRDASEQKSWSPLTSPPFVKLRLPDAGPFLPYNWLATAPLFPGLNKIKDI